MAIDLEVKSRLDDPGDGFLRTRSRGRRKNKTRVLGGGSENRDVYLSRV